jgi:putative ABC transport system ATP-binding protein
MTDPAAVIETRGLSRVFRRGEEEIHALRDVSLSVYPGEFVAITGTSGSGKSTLMYILGLIDRQSAGSYLLNGRVTDSLSDDARAGLRNQQLGFVFQGFHLLPRSTAERNVAMPMVYAASHGQKISAVEVYDRARSALERVGMGDRLQHKPNELSGGQRQRVAIARALINSPRVVFADEPTGNLDSQRGQEILDLFEKLNRDGVTIVLVTHDAQLAVRAKRQIIMKDGSIISDTGATHAAR